MNIHAYGDCIHFFYYRPKLIPIVIPFGKASVLSNMHILINLLCVYFFMGRWDAGAGIRFPNIKKSRIRIAKYTIIIGFVIVAVVVLSVFIPRSGLNVEIIERSEVMGTMQTVSVKISNNNFGSLSDVEVQFGDQGQVQPVGDMGPFSSVMITPPDLEFDSIIVRANDGEVEVIKSI